MGAFFVGATMAALTAADVIIFDQEHHISTLLGPIDIQVFRHG
jgi:hypothetical protein